ncbi:hypothetical protein MKX03_011518 [Papaver bracteatum]|nr:hypothetical protein MKX03_011518 [Papaver bracteatum]
MEFRTRDYIVDQTTHSFHRVRAESHPLATRPSINQCLSGNAEEFVRDDEGVHGIDDTRGISNKDELQLSAKEWSSFKRSLAQRFSVLKMVSISSMHDVIVKDVKVHEKPSTSLHLDELNDPEKFAENDVKVITRQEYLSRLRELKDEIRRAWQADERVTSLKLSIKVKGYFTKTCVHNFKEYLYFGKRLGVLDAILCSFCLSVAVKGNFVSSDIRSEAKETCYNWFCKIGSIREHLPRIYLELPILHCWRFQHDQLWQNLERLVMMTRGIADPLASAYCRLYMARCAQKLLPSDKGYLITCISDINLVLTRIVSEKEPTPSNSLENKNLLINLVEPTIEWITRCILKDAHQKKQAYNILKELGVERNIKTMVGNVPCTSIVLHYILKELPAESVCSHAVEIMKLIESNKDISLDQYMNYRLLGLRLCEKRPPFDFVSAVLGNVFQVSTLSGSLDQYLKVVDGYIDLVFQHQMDNFLAIILDGIFTRAANQVVVESELSSLQSIFVKLLAHVKKLEDAFALNHFVEIVDVVMYGGSRDVVYMHILGKAIKSGNIHDPATIRVLFEFSQTLHQGLDFANIKDDQQQQSAHLISRFIQMVDYGTALERHLEFLVECRGAFGRINELKETLVRASNNLAIKAIKGSNKPVSFIKSCISFSEVTIPSVSASVKQINLYLETAEVALLGGLFSHTDGLVDSAISCFQSLDLTDGSLTEMDGVLSMVQKLCSLLIIIPGDIEHGVAYYPRSILSLINSKQWITPKLRTRAFCAIVSLSATLFQNKLPYHVNNKEIMSNDELYFGDPSYYQEFISVATIVVKNIVNDVKQEQHGVTRGSTALEACNCILTAFKIAKSCLNANDKYLRSTVNLMRKSISSSTSSLMITD